MTTPPKSFGDSLRRHWAALQYLRSPGSAHRIAITGRTLDVAAVVAVARYGVSANVQEDALRKVAESEAVLRSSLEHGLVVYGVNTGFGGSADTRTQQVEALQREVCCASTFCLPYIVS